MLGGRLNEPFFVNKLSPPADFLQKTHSLNEKKDKILGGFYEKIIVFAVYNSNKFFRFCS